MEKVELRGFASKENTLGFKYLFYTQVLWVSCGALATVFAAFYLKLELEDIFLFILLTALVPAAFHPALKRYFAYEVKDVVSVGEWSLLGVLTTYGVTNKNGERKNIFLGSLGSEEYLLKLYASPGCEFDVKSKKRVQEIKGFDLYLSVAASAMFLSYITTPIFIMGVLYIISKAGSFNQYHINTLAFEAFFFGVSVSPLAIYCAVFRPSFRKKCSYIFMRKSIKGVIVTLISSFYAVGVLALFVVNFGFSKPLIYENSFDPDMATIKKSKGLFALSTKPACLDCEDSLKKGYVVVFQRAEQLYEVIATKESELGTARLPASVEGLPKGFVYIQTSKMLEPVLAPLSSIYGRVTYVSRPLKLF